MVSIIKEGETLPNTTKERLLTLIKSKGLTQSYVASHIGTHKANFNKIVLGKHEANELQKIRIAKVLEVDSRVIWP